MGANGAAPDGTNEDHGLEMIDPAAIEPATGSVSTQAHRGHQSAVYLKDRFTRAR